MTDKYRKNSIVTMRCSEDEKELITKKAKKLNKTFSQYVIDSAVAGCERKGDRDKKRLGIMLAIQEKQNEIQQYISSNECKNEPLKEMIAELLERENKLWEC